MGQRARRVGECRGVKGQPEVEEEGQGGGPRDGREGDKGGATGEC